MSTTKNYVYNANLNPRPQSQEWLTARRQELATIGQLGTKTQQQSPARLAELEILNAEIERRNQVTKVRQAVRPPGPYSAVLQAVRRPA